MHQLVPALSTVLNLELFNELQDMLVCHLSLLKHYAIGIGCVESEVLKHPRYMKFYTTIRTNFIHFS